MNKTKYYTTLLIKLIFIIILSSCSIADNKKNLSLSTNSWTYIQIDDSRNSYDIPKKWWKLSWFGMDTGDINGDGLVDIACGKWLYTNPGGDMQQPWPRIDLGWGMDILFITDVDNDQYADVIAMKQSKQYWIEATNIPTAPWKTKEIASLPICNHFISTMGYKKAKIFSDKTDLILSGQDNSLYIISIPENPNKTPWPSITISKEGASEKDMTMMDLDGDGDLDIITAYSPSNRKVKQDEKGICWFENPGQFKSNWKRHKIGMLNHKADRFEIADINEDGLKDLIVTEGRWPGNEPDASLYWLEQPKDLESRKSQWAQHQITKAYSMNSLSAVDMDNDNDIDLVVAEHKGPLKRLNIFENQGKGQFKPREIHRGLEHHMGAKTVDLDQDGDLDIISFGYDQPEYLHLWRNDQKNN